MKTGLKCYEFFDEEGHKTASVIATGFYEAIAQVGDKNKANSDMDWDSFYSAANDDYEAVTGDV